MGEEERERLEGALAVVDRWHAAEGTVVPSARAAERGRRELVGVGDGDRYGVEMKYGLDIEALLAKGVEEMRSQESESKSSESETTKSTSREPMKRKTPEPCQIPPKRVCLGTKDPKIENQASLIETPKPKSMDDDVEQLLSAATILVTSKAHLTEIQTKIPNAVYLNVTDANKENSPQNIPHLGSFDHLVLVNRFHRPSVRAVLGMVRNASVLGGRWHVYNWKIINCMNGDTNINWRNEHLWTYINGNVY